MLQHWPQIAISFIFIFIHVVPVTKVLKSQKRKMNTKRQVNSIGFQTSFSTLVFTANHHSFAPLSTPSEGIMQTLLSKKN